MKNDPKQQVNNLIQCGDFESARRLCTRLCEVHQDDAHLWFLLGAIHGALNDYEAAAVCCRKVLTIQPDLPMAHYNLAVALYKLGDPQAAIPRFQRAIELGLNMPLARYQLGHCFLSTGHGQLATEEFRCAARTGLRDPQAGLELGNQLYSIRDYELALQCYRQTARLKPGYIEALHNTGNALLQLGRANEAVGAFREVLVHNPGFHEAIKTLGLLYLTSNRPDEARAMYEAALAANPDHAGNLCEYAKFLSETGDTANAVRHLNHARRMNPGDHEIEYLLSSFEQSTVLTAAKNRHVLQMFDDFANDFDEKLVNELGYRIPEQLQELALSRITPARRSLDILDFGCGTGLAAPLFRPVACHLTGVDLAPKMIEKAAARNAYDALHAGEFTEIYRDRHAIHDLVLAADVFIYIGELSAVFETCTRILRSKGWLLFSVETVPGDSWTLRASGRFGHSSAYIERLAATCGFAITEQRHTSIRNEFLRPVPGLLFLLRKER